MATTRQRAINKLASSGFTNPDEKEIQGAISSLSPQTNTNPFQKAADDLKKAQTLLSGIQKSGAPEGSFSSDGGDIPFRNAEQEAVSGGGKQADAVRGTQTGTRRLTSSQSNALIKDYGLVGFGVDVSGMTQGAALDKIRSFRDERAGQTSSLTSGAFNPESLAGVKKTFDDFKFAVDEISNYPFMSRQEKNQKATAITESFSGQFAKNFGTAEDFNNALQNENVRNLFGQYESLGGDVNNVAAKVENKGLSTGYQSPSDYVGALDTRSKEQAFEALIPQHQLAQDEIAFEQNIPQEQRDYYYGTPEQIGFVERQEKQAEAEIKLIERAAKLDEKNARAQVDYAMDKMAAQNRAGQAKIEQNRLAAKNYMTGALAKLGALKTTGAAPQALGVLEQKYQQQAQEMQSNFDFANRELGLKLTQEVDNIGIDRDNDILKIKGDLSKSEEQIWKEIFKLQNTADRRTFDILGRYNKDFKREAEKYEKEAKKAADKYTKDFLVTALDRDLNDLSFDSFIGRGGSTGQSFTPEGRIGQVPPFLQTLLDSNKVSVRLQRVISGESTSITNAVEKEMRKLGITFDMLPDKATKDDDIEAEIEYDKIFNTEKPSTE